MFPLVSICLMNVLFIQNAFSVQNSTSLVEDTRNDIKNVKLFTQDKFTMTTGHIRKVRNAVDHVSLLFANQRNLSNIDLETSENIMVVGDLNKAEGVDYDFEKKLVFWTDMGDKCIYSTNIENGSPIRKIVEGNIEKPFRVAVDWIHSNIYWTDEGRRTISVASMDGKLVKLLFQTNLDEPRAIVVNPLEGWMFWADWGIPAKIERAGLDGSHRSTIVSEGIHWPSGLAIDYVNRKLFWVDVKFNTLTSSDYDGMNIKLILKSATTLDYPTSLDVFEGTLYWTVFSSRSIFQADINGKNVTSVASRLHWPRGIKVYHRYKQPNGTNYCEPSYSKCTHMCLPAPHIAPGTDKFTCTTPDEMADDVEATEVIIYRTINVDQVSLLFANQRNLSNIDLETSEKTMVVGDLNRAEGVDYDFEKKLVFWTDMGDKCIYSANIENGSPIRKVVEGNIEKPLRVAVDWIHSNIYWTDEARRTISVASMDGKLVKLLFHTNLDEPRAIVVNPLEGWMFWTDWGTPAKIERSGLDGSHRSTIVSEGIHWPSGLAIDYVNSKLFWVDVKFKTLTRCDYDGMHIKLILKSEITLDFPTSLDVFEGTLYWTVFSSRSIFQADINGRNVTTVASKLHWPRGIKVYHRYKQTNGTNYCEPSYSKCIHMCLPAPHIAPGTDKFTCTSPDEMAEDIEATEVITYRTVNVDHVSLLFANQKNVSKIDLETSENNMVVGGLKRAESVDYDFEKKLVFWTELGDKCIYSANIENGFPIQKVVESNKPNRIAVDWIHKNIYFTDEEARTIRVVSMDGKRVKLLFQANLYSIQDIVVNPLEGWMFWIEYGRGAQIERAGLDGTHHSTIVSEGLHWRRKGLAIDYVNRKLFWVDDGGVASNSLSSCDYDGKNTKLILNSATTLDYLTALDVYEGTLYWTVSASRSIFKADINEKNVTTVASRLHWPRGVKVYHKYKQPNGTNYCEPSYSNCTQMCLPAPHVSTGAAMFTCTSPDEIEDIETGTIPYTVVEECDCGSRHICEFQHGRKICTCLLSHADNNGTCEECDCGSGHTCDFLDGRKTCRCFLAHADNNGTCEACMCGGNYSCMFERGRKMCICPHYYEEHGGKCEDVLLRNILISVVSLLSLFCVILFAIYTIRKKLRFSGNSKAEFSCNTDNVSFIGLVPERR